MAGKKRFKASPLGMPTVHFRNPMLQKAYEDWVLTAPQVPVKIEYYDPTTVGGVVGGPLKKTPTTTRMDPYEVMRGQQMEKYKYGWNSGAEPLSTNSGPSMTMAQRKAKQASIYKKAGRTGPGGGGTGGSAAKKLSGADKKFGAGAQDLITGKYNANARLQAMGVAPVSSGKHNSIWNRTLDLLMRGNYAAAEGVRSALKDAEDGTNPISQVESFGKGALQGLEGKKKTTFGKVLHEQGFGKGVEKFVRNNMMFGPSYAKTAGNVAEGGAGLGLDVALDPSSYMGFGLVGHTGQAEKLSARAVEHLQEGSKIVSRGRKAPHSFDDIQHELLTGRRHIDGKVRHSEEALIYEPIRAMRNSIEKTRFSEVRDELRASDPALAANTKKLHLAARQVAQKEADDWMVAAVKNYQDIVETRIQKGIGFGLQGKNGRKATIVPAPALSAITGRIKNIDVVDRGLKSAAKYLQASSGITPDLHNLRQTATSSGITRAEFQGNRLRQGFSGMHRDIREQVWDTALNRGTHSGERITVDGIQQDAAEFMNKEIDVLDQHATGVATGNTPMSPRELNQKLPPGFKGKFTGKNGVVDIRNSMKNWDYKDGPGALHVAQQAYEQANAMRSMYVSAADAFGMRTLGTGAMKNATPVFDGLKSRGWREVSEKKTNGLLKGVLFDPETASGMEKMIDLIGNERKWNPFLRKVARITAPIKFYLTVPNPGYHVRNMLGDIFINELDNVGVKSYDQALQVLHHASEKYGGVKPLIMEEGNLLEKAYQRPSQVPLFHTAKPLRKPNGTKSTVVTEAEIYAGMNQYGITQNYTLSLTGSLADNPNILKEHGGKIKSWMISKSEMRENYTRLAHFVELVKRNPNHALTLEENMAWAAARIRKTHFDYTDFTKFEKQVASNVIPFYKWTRKAVPLMAEIMFTNPGKAIVPTKAQVALSRMAGYNDPMGNDPIPNLQGMLPQWMIDAGYTPGNPSAMFPGKSGPGMFDMPDPFSDTMTQTVQPIAGAIGSGDPKQMLNTILQQSNPLGKVPYELVQNENTFMSKGGNTVPVYRPDTKKKDLTNYFINQIPYARQINRAFGGGPEKNNFGGLSSQLTGIYSQELTPSLLKGELYRQEILASKKWTDVKKDLTKQMEKKGIKPPTTVSEWDDFLQAYAKINGTKFKRPQRQSNFKSVLP